jgi:hypothetical protein
VKEQICQVVSEEELAAYAEGDLSPGRAEQIAAHVENCRRCRTMLNALERSLHVTEIIWQTGEAQWPKTRAPGVPRSNRWSYRRVAAIAAGILLVVGIGLTWRLLSGTSERRRLMGKEPTAAEIEVAADRAAIEAQMLAMTDLLSSLRGGKQYAVRRFEAREYAEANYEIDSELTNHAEIGTEELANNLILIDFELVGLKTRIDLIGKFKTGGKITDQATLIKLNQMLMVDEIERAGMLARRGVYEAAFELAKELDNTLKTMSKVSSQKTAWERKLREEEQDVWKWEDILTDSPQKYVQWRSVRTR